MCGNVSHGRMEKNINICRDLDAVIPIIYHTSLCGSSLCPQYNISRHWKCQNNLRHELDVAHKGIAPCLSHITPGGRPTKQIKVQAQQPVQCRKESLNFCSIISSYITSTIYLRLMLFSDDHTLPPSVPNVVRILLKYILTLVSPSTLLSSVYRN